MKPSPTGRRSGSPRRRRRAWRRPRDRARVDALLPKVDAVAWVLDPEKYKDEVVHDAYLRTWAPRVGRQLVILNRADLLAPEDVARVRDDVSAQLSRDGLADATVAIARARQGPGGIDEVRRWLDAGLEAKRVIAGRVAAEAPVAIRGLARPAGIADEQVAPLGALAPRPAVASLAAPADAERRLADAVDRALTAEASELRTPTSFIWSLIGFGQYLVTGLLVFGALWLAALFVLHDAPSGSVDLPYLGPVPTPVVFIAAVLLAGYLLALALRYHAGWLGRRWARRIGALVAREVPGRLGGTILAPLDALDAGRERLAAASRGIEDDCA